MHHVRRLDRRCRMQRLPLSGVRGQWGVPRPARLEKVGVGAGAGVRVRVRLGLGRVGVRVRVRPARLGRRPVHFLPRIEARDAPMVGEVARGLSLFGGASSEVRRCNCSVG